MFKIAAIRDIKNLFGKKSNALYAGFGNKDTDAIAYRTVGLNFSKIFIINPDGVIFQINSSYYWSYNKLNDLVEHVFPHIESIRDMDEKYTQSQYWNLRHNLFSTNTTSNNKKVVDELLNELKGL